MTTIVTRAGKGSPLTWNEVDNNFTNLNSAKYESGNNATFGTISGTTITASSAFSGALNGTVGATTPASGSFTSITDSGNLTFTGTENRIRGDFSNATRTNRVLFQSSTTNGSTNVAAIPNGTSTTAALQVLNNNDPTNAALGNFVISSTQLAINSAISGTGTYLPMVFSTNGSERMRIDTSGNVGIGTSSPIASLDVRTAAGTAAIQNIYTGSNAAAATLQFGQVGSTAWDVGITATSGNFQIGVNGSDLGYSITRSGTAIVYHAWLTNGSERMSIHASGGVSIGNTTDSGAASLNVSGSISGGYIAHAAGTTAMAFGADNVVRVTPNASATYTTTVPAAGAICVLSILTSGTTSYTITFGTGFKATGTLATGTVSARYFNITFVSDGTNLIEMSRTVAIA